MTLSGRSRKADEGSSPALEISGNVRVRGGVRSPCVLLVEQLILLSVMKYIIVSQQNIY